MITRRSFLTALAALPVVGKLIPQTEPLKFHKDAFALVWPMPKRLEMFVPPLRAGEKLLIISGDRAYEFEGPASPIQEG